MTNTAVQSMITTYGKRVFCINLDNTRFIYIGYNNGVALTDISFETIDGIDFIKVHHTVTQGGNTMGYTTCHVTSGIQWVGIMDADSVGYGVDPLVLR